MHQPHELVIAADGMFTEVDYADDQIWEVIIGQGDPPAMAIQTSYGMRAVFLRFFPIFTIKSEQIVNPANFYQPPRLLQFYPNYLKFGFLPFVNINVVMEYWVPGSKMLAGRMRTENSGVDHCDLRLDWIGQLKHAGDGEIMVPDGIDFNTVLSGKAADIHPVCFISGGPQISRSAFSGLALQQKLYPGSSEVLHWAVAGHSEKAESFTAARNQTFCNWDAEISRLERLNQARMAEIFTGYEDWDATLAFSQKTGLGLLMPGGNQFPNRSFVISRQPDQGFSKNGTGSDHPFDWSGQALLDAYYLSLIFLPFNVEFIKGIIENVLAVQGKTGVIDWRPGIAGQRTGQLAQPLLAGMVLKVMEVKLDPTWLKVIHSRLIDFLLAWLQPKQDKDRDGFPEWKSALQAGLGGSDANFHDFTDYNYLESPGLAAMLLNESRALIQLGEMDGEHQYDSWLNRLSEKLITVIDECWREEEGEWISRDYQTHRSFPALRIANVIGSRKVEINKVLKFPQRICISVKLRKPLSRPIKLTVEGEFETQKIKLILLSRDFRWDSKSGSFTSSELFSQIGSVQIEGLEKGDSTRLHTMDSICKDISNLLPYWAVSCMDPIKNERVEKTIQNRYQSPFGLLMLPRNDGAKHRPEKGVISFPWNAMIIEGLLRHGKRAEAAALILAHLDAASKHLSQFGEFRALLTAENGYAIGERGSLHGLIPVGLFLKIAGIDTVSQSEIILNGLNPFPKPITLKYQGTTIILNSDKTVVLLNNKDAIEITKPERVKISL